MLQIVLVLELIALWSETILTANFRKTSIRNSCCRLSYLVASTVVRYEICGLSFTMVLSSHEYCLHDNFRDVNVFAKFIDRRLLRTSSRTLLTIRSRQVFMNDLIKHLHWHWIYHEVSNQRAQHDRLRWIEKNTMGCYGTWNSSVLVYISFGGHLTVTSQDLILMRFDLIN